MINFTLKSNFILCLKFKVNISNYYIASNSRAKWRSLIGWLSVGILQYGPLPRKQPISVFFPSPDKFKLSKTQKVKYAEFNFFTTTVQLQ